MASFKDFFKANSSNSDLLLSSKSQEQEIAVKLGGALSVSQTKEFSSELSKVVRDDDFISDLSEKLGKPKDNETEDEFVERAKNTMRSLLNQKLSK
jgi:hypothetical protein